MKRYVLMLFAVIASAGTAVAQDGVRQLSLKEAIKLAVENNLDVKAELYNTASAEADIHRYLGIYNPFLNLLVNYQDSDAPFVSSTTTTQVISRDKTANFNAGISQIVPTGGTVGFEFNNSWSKNRLQTSAISREYYESAAVLSLTQPLLKNFGRETTELSINVARFNKEGVLELFRTRLLDIVSQVESQYNQLYSLRENLAAKKTSLDLAETILNNTQAQVKAGVLPAMEILNARFGVAVQQKNLIDAERAIKDQVDSLRNLLLANDISDIIPTDVPFRDNLTIDETQAISLALVERPDIRQQRVILKASELQSRVARTQTLPQLDLSASAAFTGLADSYNRNLERIGSGDYPIWVAGLQFSYPIGNDTAKNDYIKSKLKVEQVRTQISSLESAIARDVRIASRAVRSGFQQLDVTARGRAYAEEVLQAYIKKQKVGLATTKDVLDVLNNLVAAKTSEIQAVTDYNNAIVALWKTTGELLSRKGITLDGKEADELYRMYR